MTLTYKEAKLIEIITKDTNSYNAHDNDFILFNEKEEKNNGWNVGRSYGTMKIRIHPNTGYLAFYDAKIIGNELHLTYGSNKDKITHIPIDDANLTIGGM